MTTWRIQPAEPARWDDVQAVMGTRGDPSRCWCQFFHRRGRDWSAATPADNRDRLCAQIGQSAVPPGLLAYADSEPVGWCQVGPKEDFDRLRHSPTSAPPSDDPDPAGLWAVTCFVVRPGHRRQGATHELLAAAVEHAAAHGGRAAEGYPVDSAARAKVSSAELYHGTLTLFLAAGFRELRRPSATRVVVRRALTG
jgi:GNAT superfamily N-acetyltransferase